MVRMLIRAGSLSIRTVRKLIRTGHQSIWRSES